MDAIQFLKGEHANANEKFQEIEHAGPQSRGDLWKELKPELKVHEHIEDEFLYGPLSKDPRAKGTPVADFQTHQNEDVAELEKAIATLEAIEPNKPEWLTQLKAIHTSLAGHIKVEETEILPGIAKIWDAPKLEQAGTAMAEEKKRKLDAVRR
jgi:hypothetical protein